MCVIETKTESWGCWLWAGWDRRRARIPRRSSFSWSADTEGHMEWHLLRPTAPGPATERQSWSCPLHSTAPMTTILLHPMGYSSIAFISSSYSTDLFLLNMFKWTSIILLHLKWTNFRWQKLYCHFGLQITMCIIKSMIVGPIIVHLNNLAPFI